MSKRKPFFLTYYTLQDLNGDFAGMVELRSLAAFGQVFVDWDNYMCARNQYGARGPL